LKCVEVMNERMILDYWKNLDSIKANLDRKNFMTTEEYSKALKEFEELETKGLFESLGPNIDFKGVLGSLQDLGERAGFTMQERIARRAVEELERQGRKEDAKILKKQLKEENVLPPFKYLLPLKYLGYGAIGYTIVGTIFDFANTMILGFIPGPINLIKALTYHISTGLDFGRSLDLALSTNTLNSLGFLLGETDASKVIGIYNQLEGSKDPNVYNLVRFFLRDGRISPEEVNSKDFYLLIRGGVVPKELLPYWPINERGEVAYKAVTQILEDGSISPDEQTLLDYIPKSKRPMTIWNEIGSGIFKNLRADKDGDGYSAIEEALFDSNDGNSLWTPLTNPSEVFIFTINGGGGGQFPDVAPGAEENTILVYEAIKHGVPKDHITSFFKIKPSKEGDFDFTPSLWRRSHYFPEIKGNIVKDGLVKMSYIDEAANRENLLKEFPRFLQRGDDNDVLLFYYRGEGGAVKLFYGHNQGDFEEVTYGELYNILKSTPRNSKLVWVIDSCGAGHVVNVMLQGHGLYSLKDVVSIGSTNEVETSGGVFSYIFMSRLRDGYSIRDAVPRSYRDGPTTASDINHPVLHTGEGDYSWVDNLNPFGRLTKEGKEAAGS